LATETAPRIKAAFDAQGADVVPIVPIVPFCPACHRAMMVLATRQVVQVPLDFQADGGHEWVDKTFQLYREGSQVVLADAVAHGKPASLAGQEKEFTIRCTC
jgi:hypothetical protein